MSEIIAFLLGIWFGGFIVIISYGGNKIMEKNDKRIMKINKIIIQDEFRKHPPKNSKIKNRENFLYKTGYFYSPIIVNDDNILIDGYISYLIAKKLNLDEVEVVVGMKI